MIEGKCGITAKVIADSVSSVCGTRLTTFEVTYPRIVHSEVMTHRMLSKNSASSRAIPFAKMAENLKGRPVRFGQANPGMQDKGEDYDAPVTYWNGDPGIPPAEAWQDAKLQALSMADNFYKAGYAKQVFNRLTEPFQMMKTVISGTEWNNFFWLRDDDAADPSLRELARVMRVAREESVPLRLDPGEYHLPYVTILKDGPGTARYFIGNIQTDLNDNSLFVDVETAIKVSSARSAAVSFRNVDYGVEKSVEVYERLVGDQRKHGSAMEHQATPMREFDIAYYDRPPVGTFAPMAGYLYINDGKSVNLPSIPHTWEPGVSHVDKNGNLWSGNLKGFIQHRKLILGENKEG